jgi:hypothetical protein
MKRFPAHGNHAEFGDRRSDMHSHSCRSLGYIALLSLCKAAKELPQIPFLQLDFYHIKTPQLMGIIAGCVVFIVTISIVIYLLYSSGTLGRAWEEIVQDGTSVSLKAAMQPQPVTTSQQFASEPELYDYLLELRNNLPILMAIPHLDGLQVFIRGLHQGDVIELFHASSGQAVFHESSYDPQRLWGWIDDRDIGYDTGKHPWSSKQQYATFLQQSAGAAHAVIIDKEFKRPIGLISLVDNCPHNLTIRVGKPMCSLDCHFITLSGLL